MKKVFSIILVFTIFLEILLLTGCSENNEEEQLKKKVTAEVKYLDSTITSILNRLNNISFQNYTVSIVQEDEDKEESSESGTQGQSQSGGSATQDSSTGGSQGESESENKKVNVSEMTRSSVLNNGDGTPEWEIIKGEIEDIYSSWNTAIIDLYKMGVNNYDILAFSQILDRATIAIKNEDKATSAKEMAELYTYIPKYIEKVVDEAQKNIKEIKSCLINAYAAIEEDNWGKATEQINTGEGILSGLMNNVTFVNDYSFNANKIYVTFSELKNSISLQDKDVFYLKYRDALKELDAF